MPETEKTRSMVEQEALAHRQRAEHFRMVSETTRNPVAKAILRDLGDAADEFAARLERHAETLRASPSSSAALPEASASRSS